MRRLIILFLLFLPFTGFGSEDSARLYDAMNQAIKSLGDYRVDFKMSVGDLGSMSGYFAVKGNMSYVNMGEVEYLSDSKVRYDIKHYSREVNIDFVSQQPDDLFSNPSSILDFMGSGFEHNLLKDYVLVLTPKNKELGIENIVVFVSSQDYLPLIIVYKMLENEQTVEITIDKISKLSPSDKEMFRFDKKVYKGYEIIDFR